MPQDLAGADMQAAHASLFPEAESGSRLEPHIARALSDYESGGNALFNDNVVRSTTDGVVLLKKEKPDHRIMVILKAQGKTSAEIAELLQVTPTTVNYVLRQPWARKLLLELIHASGEAGVDAFLQSELMPSLMRLVDVRDDPAAKKGEQLAAANSLIDRFLGKAVARVETSSAPAPSTDPAALQVELERLRQEEARLRGN
jgi:hypothetical protein